MRNPLLHAIILIFLFSSCNTFRKPHNPQKTGANDPFKESMVKSEFFEFNSDKGNVIEGDKGTIVSFPKGCFVNSNGDEVNENVKVELAEALDYGDMILSNLTTTSNGKLLETDGMIYLNATTAAGENLFINKSKPVYVEIPTEKKRAGMMAYTGVRDDNGNMDWIEPKEIENYLVNVDMSELNFLPNGFAEEVKQGMPFKDYRVATKELTDSLYYCLSEAGNILFESSPAQMAPNTNLNEPHYNPDKEVVDGKYTKESYNVQHGKQESDTATEDLHDGLRKVNDYGVDPAIIKAMRSEKFQKTFIATREFESRMQTIFQTCKSSVLLLYVKNTDKKLWEIDEMAAKELGEESAPGKKFKAFAALRQTNVRDADANAEMLKQYFDQRLSEIRMELSHLEGEATRQMQEHNRVVDSVADAYRALLWEREKYRMERYGFEFTSTGWINVDTGTLEKDWFEKKLEVTVAGGKNFDRVETYIVYETMRSIYHLETLDNEIHFVGQDPERKMLMPRLQSSKIAAIAYRGDSVYMGVTGYITGSSETAAINLSASDEQNVKRVLTEIENGTFKGNISSPDGNKTAAVYKYGSYAEENSIAVDLAYQAFFYKERKFQEQQHRDFRLLESLAMIAYPCICEGETVAPGGASLFKSNCSACHSIFADGTGPAMAGITKKRSISWLISFTRNWMELVDHNDPLAISVANSRPSAMNIFETLSDCQIRAIYRYIDSESSQQVQ